MAKKSKGLSVNKKITILIVVFLIIIVLVGIGIAKDKTNVEMNATKNEYQQEINGIVSSDFTLVDSTIDEGIDVGTTLVDDYTTPLPYDQAISIFEDNASKKGYPTPVYADCFGGIEYDADRGRLRICETKIKKGENGETTFKISLNDFGEDSSQNSPSVDCVGDCKTQ